MTSAPMIPASFEGRAKLYRIAEYLTGNYYIWEYRYAVDLIFDKIYELATDQVRA